LLINKRTKLSNACQNIILVLFKIKGNFRAKKTPEYRKRIVFMSFAKRMNSEIKSLPTALINLILINKYSVK